MLFLPLAGLHKHNTLEQKIPLTVPHTLAAVLGWKQKMLTCLSIVHAQHLRRGQEEEFVGGTYGGKRLPGSGAVAAGFVSGLL